MASDRGFRTRVDVAWPLVVLLTLRCGKDPEPPTPAPASLGGPTAAAEPEPPRLRDFELADPRDAEIAVIVHGDAEIGIYSRGPGPLELEIARDGEAPESRSVAASTDAKTPAVAPLPGAGSRAVKVRAKAPAGTTIERARVKDETPRLPAAKELVGALRGRSLVIVACDALTAGHVRSYGGARETSPNVDALARDGVRFANARSQTSWTVPSVSTLMTGLEQERHGVRDIGEVLDPSVPTLAEAFKAAGYATAAFVQNQLLRPEAGLSRGFDSWQEFARQIPLLLLPALADYLKAPRDQPCFVYVHFFPPHAPYQPPAEFASMFGQADGAVDGSEASIELLNRTQIKPGDAKVQKLAALYDNHVAFGDHLVGEVVKLLAARGREKSALLFLSDHGEGFAEHGAVGHIVSVHDEMVHVPMILSAPGSPLESGAIVNEPVWTPDLLPSLAELFGLDVDRDLPGAPLPGSSFAGLLEGTGGAPARVSRHSARYTRGAPYQRAILFGSFKLVAPAGKRANALYDLSSDPGETNDVAAALPVVAAALRTELARWVAEGLTTSAAPGFTPDAELQKTLSELGYAADGQGGK